MQISIEEIKKLEKDSYQIIDIRSEDEVSHGAIPGALNLAAEEIEKVWIYPQIKNLSYAAAVVKKVWI